MTKKELQQKLMDFIATRDDTVEDEWWGTERVITGHVIRDLMDYLKLEKQKN